MSKPYTKDDFSDQLNLDRVWRIREISDLKSAIKRSEELERKVLLRALVTICYAHWEGHVKFAAARYHEHISLRKFTYSQLNPQFYKNYFLPRLTGLSGSKTSQKEYFALLDEIMESQSRSFSRVNDNLINTKSNLNFDVLKEICAVSDIDVSKFVDHSTFIDFVLLKRRNSIAHGEDTFIAINDVEMLTQTTVTIMRLFGDSLENLVYTEKYRSTQEV